MVVVRTNRSNSYKRECEDEYPPVYSHKVVKGVEEYKFYRKEDEKGGGQKQIGGMLVLPPSI